MDKRTERDFFMMQARLDVRIVEKLLDEIDWHRDILDKSHAEISKWAERAMRLGEENHRLKGLLATNKKIDKEVERG